jgi:phosphate transport system substrate-binding protein
VERALLVFHPRKVANLKNRAMSLARMMRLAVAVTTITAAPGAYSQDAITLVATGSSLPEPLYTAWAEQFHAEHPGTQLKYLAVGSEESAKKIISGTGDIGGGDAPIPEKLLKGAGTPIIELPSVLIGIAIVYNLPNSWNELRLSGPVLADIFLGKIKMWNDPAIVLLNPDLKHAALPIQVIHRTDGKGANYVLSDYLSKVSPEFLAKAGRGESPKWPVGTGAARAQDMAEKVQAAEGTIGFTELNLAAQAALHMARIRNAAGEFVWPTTKSIAAAAGAGSKVPSDFRISLTNAGGKESYPISSFTWLYVSTKMSDPGRARAVTEFLEWVYTKGQNNAREKWYATLPDELLARVAAKAATIR